MKKTWLQAAQPTRRFIYCQFEHAINPLRESLQQPESKGFSENSAQVSPVLISQPTIGIWFRLSQRGQLQHFTLSLPVRTQIELDLR